MGEDFSCEEETKETITQKEIKIIIGITNGCEIGLSEENRIT